VGIELRTYKGSGASAQVYSESRSGLRDGRGSQLSFSAEGRWPANFILVGDSPVKELDRQSGVSKSAGGRIGNSQGVYSHLGATGFKDNAIKGDPGFGDTGGASRFFIQFRLEEK
jgi:hypothetical protein